MKKAYLTGRNKAYLVKEKEEKLAVCDTWHCLNYCYCYVDISLVLKKTKLLFDIFTNHIKHIVEINICDKLSRGIKI